MLNVGCWMLTCRWKLNARHSTSNIHRSTFNGISCEFRLNIQSAFRAAIEQLLARVRRGPEVITAAAAQSAPREPPLLKAGADPTPGTDSWRYREEENQKPVRYQKLSRYIPQ